MPQVYILHSGLIRSLKQIVATQVVGPALLKFSTALDETPKGFLRGQTLAMLVWTIELALTILDNHY